ncbi:LysR family transcriptional regulator [Bradyrhizobium diazoefficiens]|nr:LysR family transcriptional regulator [Bradyrhizobium diazoefficiens]MBR0778020.1 LysR family transcriptional regulator [Bradyrhizobium diazoefficiens]MBR0852319.1 LysR family transcriptional regulator [Bradyrhizobium diazoefficiens]
MPQLPDFEAWAIFAKVAEKGSFSQAAEELGLAKTTVSKAVTRLEERMRTTLLHRTTRQLSLTESGRLSLERAMRIFADGTAVESEILEEAAVPRGLVRIASTIAFGSDQLARVLPDFMQRYPEVDIDLCLTDDRVDLVASGFDVALRVGPVADSSMRISRLFSFRVPVVGAPAFFDRHGRPEHPTALAKMPAVIFTHIIGADVWHFSHPKHGNCDVEVDGRVRVNNGIAAVPALVAGIGMTALPEAYATRELADGRLEAVLTEWTVAAPPLHVLTPPGKARPARVRVLIEYLRQHFAAQPWAVGIEV